jgi:predicted membrane channel-forming protein YqfA (hemolysin III family)
MTLFLIYLVGYILTMVLIFIDNNYSHTKTSFPDALLVSMFSWLTAIIFFVSVINGKYNIEKLNKWFMRE